MPVLEVSLLCAMLLVASQKLGLDPQTMIDILNIGIGKNFSTTYSMRDEAGF